MSDDDGGPLPGLARGFRKRTLVTARLTARIGVDLAKRGFSGTPGELTPGVDTDAAVAAARALLDELDGLKGLTMKLGQMMSYLDGSLPPEARKVLAKLQSAARPVDPTAIAAVLREELGADAGARFDTFEATPFAAASIGQVHRATLDGRGWAVKVQYPGIEALLRADVTTVGRLARLATLVSPMDGGAIVAELGARVLEECDYRREAAQQTRFRALFAADPDLDVPEVRADRSTRRVLTTALADGVDFETFTATAPQAARDRAAAAIYRASLGTIFRHGVYNADPHPGNYRFAADGRVTLLDFGCVKEFDAAHLAGWRRVVRTACAGDLAAFTAAWTNAGFVGRARGFDFAHQLAAMRVVYRPLLTRGPFRFTHAYVAEVNDALTFGNVNKFRLAMPPDWLFVNRLQYGLYSVLAALAADVRYDLLYREIVPEV